MALYSATVFAPLAGRLISQISGMVATNIAASNEKISTKVSIEAGRCTKP